MEAQDTFPGPPGFDELSGLDLSHLSAEERAVILQVAARAKQIEDVEQQKIRNIEDQVALYSHNARKKVAKPSNASDRKQDKTNGEEGGKNSRRDLGVLDQASAQKKANSKESINYGDKEKKECHFCSKKFDITQNNPSNSQQKKHRSKSTGSSQDGKDPDAARPSSGHCSFCRNPVCSDCTVHSTLLAKGVLCILCAKQRELVARSNLWLKSTKKNHLHRSQSVDTSLRRSHSEIGQGKINESESTSKDGRKLERRRSQSDPSSHAKSRRDSWVKTSKLFSKSSTHNQANNVGITKKAADHDKAKIPHSRQKSHNDSLSAGTHSNFRKSSLTRQTSMADEGAKPSHISRKSVTDTRNIDKKSIVDVDDAQLHPKTNKTVVTNKDSPPYKMYQPSGTSDIKRPSKLVPTAPTSGNNIGNTSKMNETVQGFSTTKDRIVGSPSASHVIDRDDAAGKVSGVQKLKDGAQSLKTPPAPSAATTIVSEPFVDSYRPLSTPKETTAKTPSAMPRKVMGKNAAGPDETKASPKKAMSSHKMIDPPKVPPRKSSLSIAASGDHKRLHDAATKKEHGMKDTLPKISITREIEEHHYHMDENDTEGDFDHILSSASGTLQMDSVAADRLSTTETNGKAGSVYVTRGIGKENRYKSEESRESARPRVKDRDNAKAQDKLIVSLTTSRLQETSNLKEDIGTNGISEKASKFTQSRSESKPDCRPIKSSNGILKSNESSSKCERPKNVENVQDIEKCTVKATTDNCNSLFSDEKAVGQIPPRSVKSAITTKHRRMPLPSTTSSTAYTIKKPSNAITANMSRKWQMADQLSDLDTDLQDFEEKMKENMRILSGETTPTSLIESDDEDELLRSATTSLPTFPTSAVGHRGFSSFQPQRSERGNDVRAKPKKLANMFMKRTTSTDSFSDLLKEAEAPPRGSRHAPTVISKSSRTHRKERKSPAPSKKEQDTSVGNISNQEKLDVEQDHACCDRRHSLPTSSEPPHVRSTFSDPCDLKSQGNIQSNSYISISTPKVDSSKKLMESSIDRYDARQDNQHRPSSMNGVGAFAQGLARCFSCGTIATQAISASSPMDVKTRIVPGTTRYSPVTVTPKPNARSVDSSTQVSPTHEDYYSYSFADGGLTLSDLKKIKTLIEALNDTSDLDELVVNKQSKQSTGNATKYRTTQTDAVFDREIPPEGENLRENLTIKNMTYNPNTFHPSQTHCYPNGTQFAPAPTSLGHWNRNHGLPTSYQPQHPEFGNGIPMHQPNYRNSMNAQHYRRYDNEEMESSYEAMHAGMHPHDCHTRHSYGGMPPPHGTHIPPDSTYSCNRGASSYHDPVPGQGGKFLGYGDWQGQISDCVHHSCQPITSQPRSRSLRRNECNDVISHRGLSADGQQSQAHSCDARSRVSMEKSQTILPRDQELTKTSRANVRPSNQSSPSNIRKCSSVPTGLNSDNPDNVTRGEVVKRSRPPSRNQIDDVTSVYEEDGYSGPDDIDQYYDRYRRRKRYPSNPTRRRTYLYESEYSDNDFADYYYDDSNTIAPNVDSFALQSRQTRGRMASTMYARRNADFEIPSNEPSDHSFRYDNTDYSRRRRYDRYYNPRPFPRSYSVQRDYHGFPRSASRRSLPEPPEDDEYSWRYEQVKLLNSATKFPRAPSNMLPRSNRFEMRGSNQIEVNRLQQTMDDLDQEERELDLRLKYLEVGRSRRSTINSLSLHEDVMQDRGYRYREDTNHHGNRTNLETKPHGNTTKDHTSSSPSVDKGQSSKSVSIYDFISDMPDENEAMSRKENVKPHRTSRPRPSSRNYEVVDDTRDILSAGQQSTGFHTGRHLFQADVHPNIDSSEILKPEYDMRPAQNRHATGTDYQSRYRKRLQENAAGRITNQRRTRGNDAAADFNDYQSGGSFDNETYYPTYFSQHQSYRFPPQKRFNRYQSKNERQYYHGNNNYLCATDNDDKKECFKTDAGLKTTKARHFEKQAYAELATTIVDMDVTKMKDQIRVDHKPSKQGDRRTKRLDLLEDDMRSVVSDSEAYHLGKETTTWFDKPSDDEMQ